ncbi:MAG: SDR family oxidoreductase [Devosia sp.]|nr:SDR family oxidoreductase [Devosia sp.]
MAGGRSLEGKAIVITGAGRGLGATYARCVTAEGAAVVVNDIDAASAGAVAAEIWAAGGRAVAAPGDVASWSFAAALIERCMDEFGGIDGLVNNAGILRPARIEDITEADLRRMIEVNLVGTMACGLAAAKHMLRQGRGAIVNVASGSQTGDIALSAYGATKGAIASLTYAWAVECAGRGVRVNAVSPLADTDMAKANAKFLAEQSAHRDVAYASLPPPESNAPVVAYLLSDRAAGVNGQVVRIAGRALSFVTHPMIASPVLDGEWTLDAVAEAFEATLAGRQLPLGLTYADRAGSR